jgi:hypothetical protein
MNAKKVEIKQASTGFYLIYINGRVVRNPRSQPMGAATFRTEEDAREYLRSTNVSD